MIMLEPSKLDITVCLIWICIGSEIDCERFLLSVYRKLCLEGVARIRRQVCICKFLTQDMIARIIKCLEVVDPSAIFVIASVSELLMVVVFPSIVMETL